MRLSHKTVERLSVTGYGIDTTAVDQISRMIDVVVEFPYREISEVDAPEPTYFGATMTIGVILFLSKRHGLDPVALTWAKVRQLTNATKSVANAFLDELILASRWAKKHTYTGHDREQALSYLQWAISLLLFIVVQSNMPQLAVVETITQVKAAMVKLNQTEDSFSA